MKKFFCILVLFGVTQYGYAKLAVPKILGNNMVLQQATSVAIWGWANAGNKVTVTFKGQLKTTIANNKGEWALTLNPMKASFNSAAIVITAGNERIELKNILVGEVWLCSGQSNMEFAMRKLAKLQTPPGANWPVNEVANANNSFIRIFLVDRKKMTPDSLHTGWANAEGQPLNSFSAVGYFFAKELLGRLNVPIGVISAAIPGSRIEPWVPKEAITRQTFFKQNINNPEGKIDGDPGKFYTSMIEPLIPFTLKGFLWYQGESNCFLKERLQYSYKMKALIDCWREKWHNRQLPFYYVQIAPYKYSQATDRPYTVYSEPEFWEAQQAVLKIPNTAMISTIDLNDNPADLHPVDKWDVGKRLANCAFVKTYKVSKTTPMGPVFKSATRIKNGFVLDFYYKGSGLKGVDGSALKGFEVSNATGEFFSADAVIKDNKVWVTTSNTKNAIAVRYAWREDAKAELYNNDSLPAMPFRTDNKLEKEFK